MACALCGFLDSKTMTSIPMCTPIAICRQGICMRVVPSMIFLFPTILLVGFLIKGLDLLSLNYLADHVPCSCDFDLSCSAFRATS